MLSWFSIFFKLDQFITDELIYALVDDGNFFELFELKKLGKLF